MDQDDPGFILDNEKDRRSRGSILEAKDIARSFAENTEAKRAINDNVSHYDKIAEEDLAKGNSFFVDPINTPPQHTPIFLQQSVKAQELRAKALQASFDNIQDGRLHIDDDGEMLRAIIRIKESLNFCNLTL